MKIHEVGKLDLWRMIVPMTWGIMAGPVSADHGRKPKEEPNGHFDGVYTDRYAVHIQKVLHFAVMGF